MGTLTCALCGQIRECLPKQIEEMEYDICPECWSELVRKLQGKGRTTKRDIIIVSPPDVRPEPDEKSLPGMPPKIWLC